MFVVTAVEIGAIGAACDDEQMATEATATTAIAIDADFMLSSLDEHLLLNCAPYCSADECELNELGSRINSV
jgi:hypothetical protein